MFFVLISLLSFLARRDGAEQDITGLTQAETATRDGIEGQADGKMPKEESGQRRRAGASRGLRQVGGQRGGAGDLDNRTLVTADKDDEQSGQGGS